MWSCWLTLAAFRGQGLRWGEIFLKNRLSFNYKMAFLLCNPALPSGNTCVLWALLWAGVAMVSPLGPHSRASRESAGRCL